MVTYKFGATVRFFPQAAIIDLSGEINAFVENDLYTAYRTAEKDSVEKIILNFSHVRYINSAGIALLVGILVQARKTQRRLLAYGVIDHYMEIFQITRISDYMKIVTDETMALQTE